MMPVSSAVIPIYSLEAGSIAVVTTNSGNTLAMALVNSSKMPGQRPMLLLGRSSSKDFKPRVVEYNNKSKAINFGVGFSFEFDALAESTFIQENAIKRLCGSILLSKDTLVMVAANGDEASEFDRKYINLGTGDFTEGPAKADSAETNAWTLLLHSDRPNKMPVVLLERSGQIHA